MKFSNVLAGSVLALSSSLASATTVFAPTDGDVNFVFESASLAGYTLAIFDEVADFGSAAYLEVTAPELIYWNGSNMLSDGDVIPNTLSIDGDFVLAISNNGGASWIGGDVDMGALFTSSEANSYVVRFGQVPGFELVIDVAPVPVPAALWLFGAGLVGLVGVARRKV